MIFLELELLLSGNLIISRYGTGCTSPLFVCSCVVLTNVFGNH